MDVTHTTTYYSICLPKNTFFWIHCGTVLASENHWLCSLFDLSYSCFLIQNNVSICGAIQPSASKYASVAIFVKGSSIPAYAYVGPTCAIGRVVYFGTYLCQESLIFQVNS